MLQELNNEIKDEKGTDSLVAGDLNEDSNFKNMQEFMVEMGIHEIFSEVHEVHEIIGIDCLSMERSA